MQSYCKREAQVSVIPLAEAHAGLVSLVGGKAAGLGELIRAGERVPEGFCVTTEAYRAGVLPQDEVRAAYARLGGGPVAVRSSATDEDLPDASFAGQHDTVLDVEGEADLLAAIGTCWRSLHGSRAAAYRQAHGTDPGDVHMAVVVQRMVAPVRAGVLYTANPVTGNRTEMLVEVGPGTAVVDGSAGVTRVVLADPARRPAGG
ncbi:PEP/pyruvate-binding domain-containing protein, partial [Micromonospora wenchangensis]